MICIIGAGLSGLITAWSLQKKGLDCLVLEKNEQPGGYLRSVRQDEYLFELGANSLLADERLMELLLEVGLEAELLPANEVSKNRFIFKNGRYQALPSGPVSLLLSPFFSWKTKLAVLRERSNRTTSPEQETLGAFFERRFSKEIVEYALDPFVSGIYAGNPYDLLVRETFPNLVDFETRYGSVLRGFMKQGTTARRKSLSFKSGMQAFPEALARQITHLHLTREVLGIEKKEGGYLIQTTHQAFEAEKIIFTAEAFHTARLLENLYPDFAAKLRQVAYAPMATVHSVYKKTEVKHSLDGFGGLNPGVEGRFSLGSIWSSSIFAGRCPEDEVLFTTFAGGMKTPEKTTLPDPSILSKVHQELAAAFLHPAAKPELQRIFKWQQALPQYNLDALPAQQQADALEADEIYFVANWKGGVSLSDCVKKSEKLAQRLSDLKKP